MFFANSNRRIQIYKMLGEITLVKNAEPICLTIQMKIIEDSVGEYFYYLPLEYFSEHSKPEDMGWSSGYDGEETMSDMEGEHNLPPIVVDAWYNNGKIEFSLVGGRHRLLMSIRTGEEDIPAIVFYPRTEESYEVLKNFGHANSEIFDIDEILLKNFRSEFI